MWLIKQEISFKNTLILNSNFFNLTILTGFFRAVISQINLLNGYVAIQLFLHAGGLGTTIFLIFTLATFFRLKVINGLLYATKPYKKHTIKYSNLINFYRLHTSTLVTIFSANVICGRVMLAIAVILPPANAFISMSLAMGKFDLHMVPFMGALVAGQLFGQFAIHWLSAQYTVYLHSHSKRLFTLNVKRACAKQNVILLENLKTAHYIAKFMVVNRYGITYGTIALISMNTFGKVCTCFLFKIF